MSVNEKYQRNKAIVLDYMKNEIEIGNKWMEEHLKSKVSVIPMDLFFKLIIGPEVSAKLKKQMNLILDCTIEYIESGKNSEKLDEIVEKNAKLYLIRDSLHQNFRKKHKMYEDAKIILLKIFRERLISYALVLEGDGKNYTEISTDKISLKDSLARSKLERGLNEDLLEIIRKNRAIISISGLLRADLIEAFNDFYGYLHKRTKENTYACMKEVGKA